MGTTTRGVAIRLLPAVAGTTLLLMATVTLVASGGDTLRAEEPKPAVENKLDPAEKALREELLKLNDITGNDPLKRALLAWAAKDKESAKKLLAVAVKMSKEKPQPFNRHATLVLARIAEKNKDVDTSAAFYRLNAQLSVKLYSERGVAEAYLSLIQLYSDHKRFADSEKVCKEFLAMEGEEDDAIERFKPLVLRRMILLVARQGGADRALKMVDGLIKSDERNWLHLALKAQVLREADKLEEAVKTYLDVIERVRKDKRLEKEEQDDYIDEYRYYLSGLYIDLNDVNKAAEQLKILLAKDPNNPGYNNDLGYVWADRGMNLPEAEKMIRKAIEEDRKRRKKNKEEDEKDNPAYLDSLGWVLFKQGKAKEAKPHLLQAVKDKDGQHVEIFDHLAEVHMALGEKAEAIAAWKKGLEHATTSKRDQKRKAEVEKKLKAASSGEGSSEGK